MVRIYFVVVRKTLYRLKNIKVFESVQKSNKKIVQKKLHTPILMASFFIPFVVDILAIVLRVDIVSMFRFFGTENKKSTKIKYIHLCIIQ